MTANRPKHYFLRAALTAVIRLCLRRSIKLQELIELSKELYVELSKESLTKSMQEASVSRISMMSGVHRKDVSRLLGEGTAYCAKQTKDLPSRVIGQWQSDVRYTTPGRRPKTLSYEGPESEFTSLVASLSKDVKPHTVLFELERLGVVRKTSHGVKLLNKIFVPKGNVEEISYYLETDASDLIAAVEQNLFEDPETPNLHLKTEYTKIDQARVPEIKAHILELGTTFHQRVRNYLSQFDADINEIPSTDSFARVSVGTFSFTEANSGDQ